jgi:nuclear pore complex protein Nup98-Nup96
MTSTNKSTRQLSSNPFGAQLAFGQTNIANTNPFSLRLFGSTSPFGVQNGTSVFGDTTTGVLGATQNPLPLASFTSAFGTS